MQTAKVYFTNLRTTPSSNLLDKMERLVKKAGIASLPLQNCFNPISAQCQVFIGDAVWEL